MSYWITLEDHAVLLDDQEGGSYHPACLVDTHAEGGTYVLGGTPRAELNVTYNYGSFFDFRSLNGRTGRETIARLREAVELFGTDRDVDYWARTPGNAGYACSILLKWATEHPDGIWRVN